jgi:hypothetical protein
VFLVFLLANRSGFTLSLFVFILLDATRGCSIVSNAHTHIPPRQVASEEVLHDSVWRAFSNRVLQQTGRSLSPRFAWLRNQKPVSLLRISLNNESHF